MPPIDRLLSQYSDPIRSWPGEEDLDAVAHGGGNTIDDILNSYGIH